MKLVIVESPTKAKTISKFLGKNFQVKSSFGHIRDLPKSKLGVDVENNFQPQYVVPTASRKLVTDLRKTAQKADEVIFATDEDREGEAISWHLLEIFKKELKEKFEKTDWSRIAFHEITKEAILEAIKNPRPLDLHLVNAQQARRILDRLVGYKLSPLLWAKVARGLSAGRVQSVAERLLVEREREILAFKPEEYWTIEAVFSKDGKNLEAKLSKIDGKALQKFSIRASSEAKKITDDLKSARFTVSSVETKETSRSPQAPFTTSTLQQEANKKLGFSAKQTMVVAQQLYETGYITYMRTDSVNLAGRFADEARIFISENFGKENVPASLRAYKAKSRLAQEAHEAIRPTSAKQRPKDLEETLESRQLKLYDLIWRRALASQMNDARFLQTGADIAGGEKYTFRAAGSRLTFPGFLSVYPEESKRQELPELAAGDALAAVSIIPKQHFTEPPPRYSDATLVKALEEYGIGRPSTYAPTISTLLDRKYVERFEGKKLKPTEIGMVVNDLLVEHFPEIMDYKFTARMEDELDEIAMGKKEWPPVIREFYEPFDKRLAEKQAELSKQEFTETATEEVCKKCGKPMVIKLGRYGKFLACTGFPDCRNTKPISNEGKIIEDEPTDEKCEACGAPMVKKFGRYGAFLSCSRYPECKTMKPILKSTGVACPKCGKGDIVERRSKRGRRFWGCSAYPDCDFVLWNEPTGEKCEKCGSLLVRASKEKTRCSNKDCKVV